MIRASWSPTIAGQIEQTSKRKPLADIQTEAFSHHRPHRNRISLIFLDHFLPLFQAVPSLPLYLSFALVFFLPRINMEGLI
jgi:hypothetical protein